MEALRSLLFVPGNRRDMLEKAKSLAADVLVPDLEDSVPFSEKVSARQTVSALLPELAQREQRIIPRINPVSTGLARDDLAALIGPHTYAINVGKIDTPRDVDVLSQIMAELEQRAGLPVGQVKLIPYIESARGVVNAFFIASASTRVIAVAFGGEDFAVDMEIQRTEEGSEIAYPRAAVATAATAAGVPALDTPFINFKDEEGLRRDIHTARALGFKGKFAIHPSQIAPINTLFGPSPEEVEYARRIVQAYEEAEAHGRGSTSLDGMMVDVPVVKRARNLLALADSLASRGRED